MRWLLLLALLATPAIARDYGQYGDTPQATRDWYKSLKQPGSGVSCCDVSDCVQVDFSILNDHYRALIEEHGWVDIPPEKVITHMGNPVGQAVVCYNKGSPELIIYCFVPGAGL